MEQSGNKKRILKNTLLLYIRQFFTLALSLYTSRLTLQVLGVSDFGIYGVVGGITALLAILTSSMSSSTQRFMTFELGRRNNEQLNRVFITSLQIHILLSIFLLILVETIGVWFLYNHMTIPHERLTIAFYVLQLATLNCILNLLNVPNNAAIVAHEDMGTFALFSIFDAILKFGAVVLLFIISWDKLLFYALFLFIIQFIDRIIAVVYCHIRYKESKYRNIFDKVLFKDMFNFAGWTILSNLSTMGFMQGANIILNMFFGPILNAAYSVAMQAYSGIRSFTSSFQLASNPQIVKLYSIGDFEGMNNLLIFVCKMSFFLIFILSLPFLINANYVLELWLNKVPEHSVYFFCLLLIFAYLDVFVYPMDIAAQATGIVKKYSIITSIVIISILPISYISYLLGAIPEMIYYIAIIVSFIGLFVRIYILSKLIHFRIKDFIIMVLQKCAVIAILSSILPLFLKPFIPHKISYITLYFIATFLETSIITFYVGLNKKERISIVIYISKYIHLSKQHD